MFESTAPNSAALIQVNGKPAEIFGHEPFAMGKVAGFIVSTEKAQFTIHIKHSFEKRPEKDLYMEFHIDGALSVLFGRSYGARFATNAIVPAVSGTVTAVHLPLSRTKIRVTIYMRRSYSTWMAR